jgi:hypothetical protein
VQNIKNLFSLLMRIAQFAIPQPEREVEDRKNIKKRLVQQQKETSTETNTC